MGWRKILYSGDGMSCVEVSWRKSSYSASGAKACMELLLQAGGAKVRDSKNPAGRRKHT